MTRARKATEDAVRTLYSAFDYLAPRIVPAPEPNRWLAGKDEADAGAILLAKVMELKGWIVRGGGHAN